MCIRDRNCVFDLTNPKTFKWFFEQVQHEVPTLMIGVINYELTFRRNGEKLKGYRLESAICYEGK